MELLIVIVIVVAAIVAANVLLRRPRGQGGSPSGGANGSQPKRPVDHQ